MYERVCERKKKKGRGKRKERNTKREKKTGGISIHNAPTQIRNSFVFECVGTHRRIVSYHHITPLSHIVSHIHTYVGHWAGLIPVYKHAEGVNRTNGKRRKKESRRQRTREEETVCVCVCDVFGCLGVWCLGIGRNNQTEKPKETK